MSNFFIAVFSIIVACALFMAIRALVRSRLGKEDKQP